MQFAGSIDAASELHGSFVRKDSDLKMTRVKKASAIFGQSRAIALPPI
jgi:hypothetical protein